MSEDAQFSIAADHPCLAGHFPNRPIVPGVLLLAHAVAAIEAVHGRQCWLRFPQVKFVQPLLPGEIARVSFALAGAQRWRFTVLRGDGTLLARGEASAA
ncbi:MAG: hypothetical protein ABIR05_06020 [Luteimonas sp.]